MEPTRNRSFLVVAVVIALMAMPMAAHSALVTITSGDGVTGGGNWTTGVSLGYIVADSGDNYRYSYTFQAPSPGLSHFILQTSDNFTSNNILEISNDHELNTFSSETQGASNPGMPGAMYGIKFEGIEGSGPWTLTLLSDRAPMEGDFYAKGGDDSFAYNSGFGEGADGEGAKILVPDTLTQRVPEAGALLLFGSGLFGLVGYRRVRRMQ